MDAETPHPPLLKDELEDMATRLVNTWLQLQRSRYGEDVTGYEKDINRFLNLSLRTVYELAAKDILQEPPAGQTAFVTKEKLLPLLRPKEEVKRVEEAPPPIPLTDPETGKTNIEAWINEPANMHVYYKARDALRYMAINDVKYLEDVTQKRFEKETKDKYAWSEFVKARGF